jgi:hypothetical protein
VEKIATLHFWVDFIRLPAKTIWGDPVLPDNLAVGTLFLHAHVFQKKRFARQTNYCTSDVTSAGPGSTVYRTVVCAVSIILIAISSTSRSFHTTVYMVVPPGIQYIMTHSNGPKTVLNRFCRNFQE